MMPMDKTPPNKLGRIFTIFMLLLLVVILALFGYSVSPIPPEQVCTLMACRDSLEIGLSHEPPTEYTLTLTTDSGDSRSISCTPQVSSHQSSAICQPGKVTFFDFTPSSVTVEISWLGESFYIAGKPSYHIFQPNGPSCPPECQAGNFQVTLP